MLPLAVGLLYAGGWFFAGLLGLMAVLMAVEWQALTTGDRSGIVTWLLAASLVTTVVLAQAGVIAVALAMLALATVAMAVAAAAVRRGPWWRCLGVIWLGLPCVALAWLRGPDGIGFVGTLWLASVVWACDTGAYVAGTTIGGPKLAPRISPKKTWAGLAGGMATAAVVSWVFAGFGYTGAVWGLAGLGALLAVVSQLGDLAESAVKRHFGVKDSGTLIPGHGGILDRVDGLLFAAPAAAMLVLWGNGVIGTWR